MSPNAFFPSKNSNFNKINELYRYLRIYLAIAVFSNFSFFFFFIIKDPEQFIEKSNKLGTLDKRKCGLLMVWKVLGPRT